MASFVLKRKNVLRKSLVIEEVVNEAVYDSDNDERVFTRKQSDIMKTFQHKNHRTTWTLDLFYVGKQTPEMINDLWTAMYFNDEERLILYKLQYK